MSKNKNVIQEEVQDTTETVLNEELLEEQLGKPDLVRTMHIVLANTFSMYLLAHKYHWNVEGPFFSAYHDFFSKVYVQLFEEVDTAAEQIRALGSYAPGTMKEFESLSTMSDTAEIPGSKNMFARLLAANSALVDSINAARGLAEREDNYGLVNYLEDRLDKHAKLAWMIKSHMVGQERTMGMRPTD